MSFDQRNRLEMLLLNPNGSLARDVEQIIVGDAALYASNHRQGVSASMNTALDYTTSKVLRMVYQALKESV